MTIDDIFSDISTHMVEGLMTHDQLATYYCFLNMQGYAKCHLYHYLSESKEYIDLKRYYHKSHNKLIKEKPVTNPKLLPESWYGHYMEDVDTTTKKSAIKTGIESWIDWETETMKLYSKAYKDALSLNEVADTRYIGTLVDGAAKELASAKSTYILLQSCNFDMVMITEMQEDKAKKYKEKINEIWR